jgi:hypothetical protein
MSVTFGFVKMDDMGYMAKRIGFNFPEILGKFADWAVYSAEINGKAIFSRINSVAFFSLGRGFKNYVRQNRLRHPARSFALVRWLHHVLPPL